MTAWRRAAGVAVLVVALVVAASVGYLVLSAPAPTPSPTAGGIAACPVAPGNASADWTTYHGDGARTGAIPASPGTPVGPSWSGPTTVDGDVYAEPLVCGATVYVATEDDSVYAINASNGATLWQTHLGTPVPSSDLPCGDINPSGITGTPVLDATNGTLYAVAFVTPGQHFLFGLDVHNGSIRSKVAVDPAGSDPTAEQQRGALAFANGYVYIPYGGLYGDCGSYHGWVVGVPLSGSGPELAYQVPTHREGGIWASGGIAVGPDGNLYVTAGNGDSSTTFDHGDSVIELSPLLQEVGYFAPTNWAQLNVDDADLGSLAPTVLPDGNVLQVGKEGVGYLLHQNDLGGVGGQVANAIVCGGGAYGGTAHVGLSVLVPCTDGLVDVATNASGLSVSWTASGFEAGSPIVTGDVVWAVSISSARLLGLNLTTGAPLYSFPLGSVDHFISPTAGDGRIFVAGGDQLVAYAPD